MKNDAAVKMSAELAAEFAARIQAPEVRAAIEATRSASDADTGTFEVVITTENIDRYNEVIKLDGWDTANYMNNPVVLLSHDSSQPPIGIATSLEVRDGKMIATGRFAPASANPVAQQIRQLYDLNIMRATSVGFIEKERQGNLITQAELLEFSFVSIPANPYALSTMVKSGLSINEVITKGLISIKDGEPEITEPTPAPAEPALEPEESDPDHATQEGDGGEKKCIECGEKADAPQSAQSVDYPICNNCLSKGWVEYHTILQGKGLKPLLSNLRSAIVALEAAVETGEPEGDGEADEEGEEERKYKEFSGKRRILQEAATVIGDVLAEARHAVEAH